MTGWDEYVNDKVAKNLMESAGFKMEEQEQLDEGKKEQPKEEVNEDVHVCPLCESVLEKPIEDDALLEHIEDILDLVDELNEELESDDEEINEDSEEEDEDEEEEDEEQEDD